MPWVNAGEAGALGRKVVASSQVAGDEELLKGTMWERELPLAVLFALADQEAGALLDVLDHNAGLVHAVVQQRPKGAGQPVLSDVGRAFPVDVLLVHLEGDFLQHVA